MLSGILRASPLGNMLLTWERMLRAACGNKKVKGMLTAGYGSRPSIKKSSIKKKFNFTPSFNKLSNTKVLSKWAIDNVPKTIKNGT